MKENPPTSLNSSEKNVLKTLAYFDVFSYPLTSEELKIFFGGNENPNGNIDEALESLKEKELVFQNQKFYQLDNSFEQIERRLKGNKLAESYLAKAKKISVFIGNFPFVRGVYISGSLSKGYMGEDADIDYFIVTKPGRLWLARTMLVMFKKLFLLNSRKYFCVNYFVDENHLEIEEKNLFTATELVTLIPTYNSQIFEELKKQNPWVKQYYPNHPWNNQINVPLGKGSLVKKFLEFLLSGKLGEYLDKKSMMKTLTFWKNKFSYFTEKDFNNALKSRSYISKHHPQNFQKKVLNAFEQKVNEFI